MAIFIFIMKEYRFVINILNILNSNMMINIMNNMMNPDPMLMNNMINEKLIGDENNLSKLITGFNIRDEPKKIGKLNL